MTEKPELSPGVVKKLIDSQRDEITEYNVYLRLSEMVRDEENADILAEVAEDEKAHYDHWKSITNREVSRNRLKVWLYVMIARIFGITFGLRLMELGEEDAQETYSNLGESVPGADWIVEEEDEHEEELLAMINEERLSYIGSIVLGLNDALVELTGALAGLTLSLQDAGLIAMAGLVTGISASLSMGASEYLSTKSEGREDALKASMYTGTTYLITVFFLILPYLIIPNYFICLGFTLLNAILIIMLFNFYISVAQDLSFSHRFFEMVGISLGVAVISFGIGFVIRFFMGAEV